MLKDVTDPTEEVLLFTQRGSRGGNNCTTAQLRMAAARAELVKVQ